jgi:outer membrane cobalamin receptor
VSNGNVEVGAVGCSKGSLRWNGDPLRLVHGSVVVAVLAGALLLFLPASSFSQVVSVVRVRVENRLTADPLPSAQVAVEESGQIVVTDVGGNAVVRGLAPGRHTLSVSAFGYEPRDVEIRVENGRTVLLTLTLQPDPLPVPGLRVSAQRGPAPPGAIDVDPSRLGATVPDLPSALEQVPGVTVVSQGGPGSPASIQLRGATSDQVLVVLNGVPLNSPLTGEVDLNAIDLASIHRIVVIPGAQSSRYGPRALGGVVLLESNPSAGSGMDVSLGAGAWGERNLSAGATWTASPAWSLSANGQWDRATGDFIYDVPDFRGGGDARRENAKFRRAGGQLQLSRRGPGSSAHLRAHISDLERGSPGAVAQPSLTGRQAHGLKGMSIRGVAGGEALGASAQVSLQWQRADYRDPTPPFGPAYDEEARVSQQDAGVEGWKRLGSLVLRGGGDFRRQRIRSSTLTPTSSTIHEGGLWTRAEAGRDLGFGTRAEVQVALRLDGHELMRGSTFSPGVVGVLQRGETRLEATFANGFSPPTLSDLFFQEGVLVKANPHLRPERVRGELSLSLTQRLTLARVVMDSRISAYRANVNDMILWFPDFRFVWSPENFAVSRRGMEVETSFLLPAWGRTHRFRSQAAWSRVEYQGGVLSGQVAYRPRFRADLEGWLDVVRGEVTVHVKHVGSRRSVAGSGLNALTPYTTVDLGLDMPFSSRLFDVHVQILLSNLFDERPALLADYPLPGRGWTTRVSFSTPDSP